MFNRILIYFMALVFISSSAFGADFVLKAAHNGSAGHPLMMDIKCLSRL